MNNVKPAIVKVLLAVGDSRTSERLRAALSHADATTVCDVCCEDDLPSVIKRMSNNSYDVILFDLSMPGSEGVESLKTICDCNQTSSFVVLLREHDQTIERACLASGADDVISESQLDDVAPTLMRWLETSLDRQKMSLHFKARLEELECHNARLQHENDRSSELSQMVQQFVDDVSHEFRTPLTIIGEFTSFVRDGIDGMINKQQRDHLDVVASGVEDLASIVNDMFDMNRLLGGSLRLHRSECRIEDIIEQIAATLERKVAEKEIVLKVVIDEALPKVYCDPGMIGRVIVHLVNKVSESTKPGDTVELQAQADLSQWQVAIHVSNNRRHLDDEEFETIHQRFRQFDASLRLRPKRFSHGLEIVKQFVHLNLGDIDVKNRLDGRHVFSFTVPTADIAKVAARYLNRQKATKREQSGACLLAVSIAQETDSKLAEEVDDFLQETIRCTDLAFRIDARTWLLMMGVETGDSNAMMARIDAARDHVNQSRSGPSLPVLHVGEQDTWDFEDTETASTCADGNDQQRLSDRTTASRILLVDDDRHIVEAAAVRLQTCGYDVITAYDGESALKLAMQCLPDAIVLDVRMPGIDGLNTLKRLRQQAATSQLPVAIMSGSLTDKAMAIELGAQYFLKKPYEAQTLIRAIDSLVSDSCVSCPSVDPRIESCA